VFLTAERDKWGNVIRKPISAWNEQRKLAAILAADVVGYPARWGAMRAARSPSRELVAMKVH
jgi:hypothetical protein